ERHRDLDVNHRANEALDFSAEMAAEVLGEAGIDRSRVIGAGIGIPGPVDRERGTAGAATILPGWVGLRLADRMPQRLGRPRRRRSRGSSRRETATRRAWRR